MQQLRISIPFPHYCDRTHFFYQDAVIVPTNTNTGRGQEGKLFIGQIFPNEAAWQNGGQPIKEMNLPLTDQQVHDLLAIYESALPAPTLPPQPEGGEG